MSNEPKQRHEVPLEDQWNVAALYADDAAWEGDFQAAQGLAEGISAYQGRLAEADSVLAEALRAWFDVNRQLEKIMERAGRDIGAMAPILEVNPKHALITGLAKAYGAADDKSRFEDAAWLLLGQARILDGELPDDPADFSRRFSALLSAGLAQT